MMFRKGKKTPSLIRDNLKIKPQKYLKLKSNSKLYSTSQAIKDLKLKVATTQPS